MLELRRSVAFVLVASLGLGLVACQKEADEATPSGDGDGSPSSEEQPSETPANPNVDPENKLTPLPSAKAKDLTAGRLHVCAVTEAGEARCWGYGSVQVGSASTKTEKYPIPIAVPGLTSGVKMISSSASSDHTCALTSAGGVKCWGDDSLGQLGSGIPYTDNRAHVSAVPLDVKDLTANVAAISVGDVSACALLNDKTVKCWGQNGSWIGDGNDHLPGDTATPNSVTAKEVTGLTNVAQVSVGHEHACAVMTAGTVKCWGVNSFGEVGIGDERPRITVPTDVPGLTNVIAITAGFRTTCARLQSGALKCWGTREYGSLGDGKKGSFDEALTPIDVTGISTATDVHAGLGMTCAVLGGLGAVKCWGESSAHGAAEGETYRTYQPAGEVVGLMGATRIVSGSEYACALVGDGAIKCWGTNGGGMLGDGKGGTTGDERSHAPVAVVSFP